MMWHLYDGKKRTRARVSEERIPEQRSDRFEMAIFFLKLKNKNWEDDINLSLNT